GIIVAIGNPPNYKRLEQPTYRSELAWPNPQYRMGPESLLFAYASPAHRATGLIGDLACSLYRGSDDALRTHLRNVWKITMQITQAAATGMTIAELYEQAGKLIVAGGFENNIYSVNDDASTNIGHTLPWSNEPMSRTEQYVIEHGTAGEQADLISHKRRFVSPKEMLKISGDLALTIEPRLNRPGLPTVGFHVVVAFEGREKVVITEFDSLFKLFGMKNLAHA
ncbi:MAG: hypothetical protein ACREP9_22965, partial [Candidatus Dormibacteraceae bacterium]